MAITTNNSIKVKALRLHAGASDFAGSARPLFRRSIIFISKTNRLPPVLRPAAGVQISGYLHKRKNRALLPAGTVVCQLVFPERVGAFVRVIQFGFVRLEAA